MVLQIFECWKVLRFNGISQDKLIANEKELTQIVKKNESRKFVVETLIKMSPLKGVVSELMQTKIIKANTDFDTLVDIYLENKEEGLQKWLSKSVTKTYTVIETIVDFFQIIFTVICK